MANERPLILPDEPVMVRMEPIDYGEKVAVCVDLREGDSRLRQAVQFQSKPHNLGSYLPVPADAQSVAERLRALADWLCSAKKARKRTPVDSKDPTRREEVRIVWALYVRVFERERAKLDDKRKVVIGKALDAGYTPLDMESCFLGYKSSAWHMGDNDRKRPFIDLGLLLRDAERIDHGLDLYEKTQRGKPPPGSPHGKQIGGRPEDRWNAGDDDGTAGGGGLPVAGAGAKEGGEDPRGVASGADAGELREAGAGSNHGFPWR